MDTGTLLPVAFAATLLPATAQADGTATSLLELLEHRHVSLTAVGTGCHEGECLRVTVRNLTPRPLRTSIPAGWVFTSEDPGVQDLLVVREEVLALAGSASRTVACRVFCCEASGRGPGDGERYRTGRPADGKLMAVAQAIARGGYPDNEAQQAVWVISDGQPIAGMGAMDSSATDSLRAAVGRLSGQPLPRYTLRYTDDPDRACSGRPESIARRLRYTVAVPTVLSAVVVDRQGRVRQVLHDRTLLEPGVHDLSFDIPVLGWPPGTYAIHAWSTDRCGAHHLPFTL